jgi:hypothetical protein
MWEALIYMESISSRIAIQATPDKNARPYLKNNQIKKSWGLGSCGRTPA